MIRFLLGLVIGLLLLPAGIWIWFSVGKPPVAVADQPFPYEKRIVEIPLAARIGREMPARSPIEPSPSNLTAGAQIYREQCAFCHGLYGSASSAGAHMYPAAPQLWKPHRNGIVGVSDDSVGETYWKVANGIRLTGMPAFDKTLNQTQMWQVSVLLKNAGNPMPASAMKLIEQPLRIAGGQ